MTTKLTGRQADKLIEAAQNAVRYAVEGSRNFPIDMLRYDLAWPASEIDSVAISRWTNPTGKAHPVVIHLKALKVPTAARWESFGWRVTALDSRVES